ncbi:MAG: bifunctional DNA primase/polymerase [Candidatus Omnitrophica bacterium]|nr:bifunctional DNA primase/polymerase [Candidatus Omnitrophota bacterium]
MIKEVGNQNKYKNALWDSANYYLSIGWSLIPVNENKIPLVSWTKYMTEKAEPLTIKTWLDKYPNLMLGVVTGKISNLSIIDIDRKEAVDDLFSLLGYKPMCPMAVTPRGGIHLYFAFNPEVSGAINIRPGIDIRSEGGYVVVPPSISPKGKYAWYDNKSPKDILIPEFPEELISVFGKEPTLTDIGTLPKDYLVLGRRDNDLFHLAWTMIRGGLEPAIAKYVLLTMAKQCRPPFDEKDAIRKVQSAILRALKKDRQLSVEVEKAVRNMVGLFSERDIIKELQIYTQKDRETLRIILQKLVNDKIIERAGRWHDIYRRIEGNCDKIALGIKPKEPLKVCFPLGLEKYVSIYPGNIIIIAGAQNAGKTAFLLNFVVANMDKFRINYFSSEMGEEEFNIRLGLFEDVKEWNFAAYERSSNFEDVIKTDEVNIIDYLEIVDNFWKVAGTIAKIQERLGKGLALIALQKDYHKELGRGASFGLEKPRLYITLDYGVAKIVKAKNWADPTINPNGLQCEFNIIRGHKFYLKKQWA